MTPVETAAAGGASTTSNPAPSRGERVEVVLFDLGGVLIRLKGVPVMAELAGLRSDAEVWERWLTCRWVRAFERGICDESTFANGIVEEWGLSVTPDAFLESFRGWPDGTLEGAIDLVEEVRGHARVGCLSNMNALHWSVFDGWALGDLFEWRFLSFELGLIKPDRAIFEHAVSTVDFDARDVLFLDDNLVNVEAARAVGLRAELVRGVAEARAALERSRVLL